MEVDRFARELPLLFEDFPASEQPRDRRFAEVLEAVPGLARENNLALLNLAVACLGEGESYVEAGSFRGTSLISAGLGNRADLIGIDRFSMDGSSREQLEENLGRFEIDATILEGEVLELLRDGALAGRRAGVYYYDAGHEYETVFAALQLAEPFLAPRALIVVDDSDWEQVGRASAHYLAVQEQARMLFDLPGREPGRPWWWEGMHVLEWNAGPA
jgi:predicted O-methyltransferase YrrM